MSDYVIRSMSGSKAVRLDLSIHTKRTLDPAKSFFDRNRRLVVWIRIDIQMDLEVTIADYIYNLCCSRYSKLYFHQQALLQVTIVRHIYRRVEYSSTLIGIHVNDYDSRVLGVPLLVLSETNRVTANVDRGLLT